MREVGILEAKTALSGLVAEVERTGQEIVLTRRGRGAAMLVPLRQPRSRQSGEEWQAMVEELLAWRDAQAVPRGFENLTWEETKRLMRDEDDHD